MVRLYKCHVLSYLEGATPAVYHARENVLKQFDDLQSWFLDEAGLSAETALREYNLAPLGMRRDIAVLGLLYKVASGLAPPALAALFRPAAGNLEQFGFATTQTFHEKALFDPIEPGHPAILRRSIYGMIGRFNRLPAHIVNSRTVQIFQRRLQHKAKSSAGQPGWPEMFRTGVYI